MKHTLFKASIMALSLLSFNLGNECVGSSIQNYLDGFKKDEHLNATLIKDDEYVGYGYNILSGKPICDINSLLIQSPIIDRTYINDEHVVYDNIGKTETMSMSSTKASEISEELGKVLSGGVGTSAGVMASAVKISADISVTFDKSSAESLGTIQQEEYGYYCFKNRNKSVYLTAKGNDLKAMLSNNFKEDLYSVRTEADAQILFKEYGTHLVTGYNLGGILSMTNYFASDLSTYTRKTTESFGEAVQTAVDACGGFVTASAGENISFSSTYGSKDNETNAVNRFKCTAYGGEAFPGLTIDQAFSFRQTAFDAGYIYQIWIESVNNGERLVITDIPENAPMIPLWDLLPNTAKYNDQRKLLLSTYIELAANVTNDYAEENPDIFMTDRKNMDPSSYTYDPNAKGYSYLKNVKDEYLTSYVSFSSDTVNKVAPDSFVTMDYDESALQGQEVEWKLSSSATGVRMIDSKTCKFEITADAPVDRSFSVSVYVNGVSTKSYSFRISNSSYSGGDGSESNPYLIATVDEFMNFTRSNLASYYKLVNDIDLSNISSLVIGKTSSSSFSGVFDGGYHEIRGFHIADGEFRNSEQIGLFGYNSGTIKNLNLVGSYQGHSTVTQLGGSTIKHMGALCGYNAGRIENVNVSNYDISLYNDNSNDDSNTEIVVSAGGLVGYNGGLVSRCSVKDINVFVKENEKAAPSKAGFHRRSAAGGLIGTNNTDVNNADYGVNGCMVDSVSARAFAGASGHEDRSSCYIHTYAGGLIGYLKDGKVSNCLVKNINGFSQFKMDVPNHSDSVNNCANIYAQSSGSYSYEPGKKDNRFNVIKTKAKDRIFANAGGLIGASTGNTNFKHNVVLNVSSVNAHIVTDIQSDTTSANFNNQNICPGLFIGCSTHSSADVFDGNFVDVTNNFVITSRPSYLDNYNKANSTLFIINEKFATNGNITGVNSYSDILDASQLRFKESLTYDDCKDTLDSDEEIFDKDDNNRPTIVQNSIVIDDGSFELEDVKTSFFVGEDFKVGDIHITAQDKAGNVFDVKNYFVDFSSYDSSKVGTYPIYVSAYGYRFEYYVNVIEPSVISIFAELIDDDLTFFEGEQVDFSLFNVEKIYDSGKREALTYTDSSNPTSNQYTCDFKTLTPGQNAIVFNYVESGETLRYTYYLSAKEKEIKEIRIVKEPSLKEFFVGSTVKSISGIEVEVIYIEGQSQIVTEEDLTIISSVIVEGDNTVYVCYDNYFQASFHVIGILDRTDLYAFIDLVDSLDSLQGLYQRYVTINKALDLYSNLNEILLEEANEAYSKLQIAVNGYNDQVSEINDDFGQSIEVSSSITSTMIEGTGFYGIALILLIMRKAIL